MIFTETELAGAFIVDLARHEDNRGFFARVFCQREFEAHGLKPLIPQANIGSNRRRGTVRGMHFQFPPAAETKYVRCVRGAVLDIIVDLRPNRPPICSTPPLSSRPETSAVSTSPSASHTAIRR